MRCDSAEVDRFGSVKTQLPDVVLHTLCGYLPQAIAQQSANDKNKGKVGLECWP